MMSERRVALLGALLASTGPIALALYTPAMPVIAEAFNADETAVKATLSSYFAGFAVAQLFSGSLSDKFGRKPVTQAFLLIFILGSLGTLFAPTIDLMIWSRLLQGIGAASGTVIARAIVRDLFVGDASARVLNFTSIVLGAGPMVAPAIGGAVVVLAGWQAPFLLMLIIGIAAIAIVQVSLVETHLQKVSKLNLNMVLTDYFEVLRNREFFWSSMTISGAVATFYAQSTVGSFIFMGQLGQNAARFGVLMLIASGGYFLGALCVRLLINRIGAYQLVPFGLTFLTANAVCLALLLFSFPPQVLSVIIPITLMIFSNAFVLPGMYTATLAPFGKKAGAAAAMSGFMTMGLGLLASLMISLVDDPSKGLAMVDLLMVAIAGFSFIMWRRACNGRLTA